MISRNTRTTVGILSRSIIPLHNNYAKSISIKKPLPKKTITRRADSDDQKREEKTIHEVKQDTLKDLFREAQHLFAVRRYAEAVKIWDEYINHTKGSYEAYLSRSCAKYYQASHIHGFSQSHVLKVFDLLQSAYEDAKMALSINPYSPEAYRILYDVDVRLGRNKTADKDMKNLLLLSSLYQPEFGEPDLYP
ncbi:tetratricopeptide repeat protein [Acrasis kona]|uniref:Tetratricopeptide repeat protein n=1 Tax=Acrasis kona TaxID=1008807 RepID=A0AAW2ZIE3_9EUKA